MHIKYCCALTLCLATAAAHANDRTVMLPIAAAMGAFQAEGKQDAAIKFYFGDQPVGGKVTMLETQKTSQKTNAFGKSDVKACNWVFQSAMLQLQKHAQKVGANAVMNIRSNYNNEERSSSTEFECHAGAIMAGVALKADFVKVAD
jgi:hypothetical protein